MVGTPQTDIATIVGVAPKTLRLHYADELKFGKTEANAAVSGNLFKMATGSGKGAVTAAIFWLKTQAHWKETKAHEHFSPDGSMSPAAEALAVDLSALDEQELDHLERLLEKAAAGTESDQAGTGAAD